MSPIITSKKDQIRKFCKKWKIVEFSIFGSALRKNFRPDSDIDVIVDFADNARWSLFDLAEMRCELIEIFDREVDFIEKGTIRNPFRRHSIMNTKEVLYAAN